VIGMMDRIQELSLEVKYLEGLLFEIEEVIPEEDKLRYFGYRGVPNTIIFNEIISIRETLKEINRKGYNNYTCKYNADPNSFNMVVANSTFTSSRTDGLIELRNFTSTADELVIIDPYIYKTVRSLSINDYIRDFTNSTSISTLKNIHIVFDPANVDPNIRSLIQNEISHYSAIFTEVGTNQIHDRIWITKNSSNEKRGKVLGSSLNSIGGRRLAFILDLPIEDLNVININIFTRKWTRINFDYT
jgi:hypothetical protein